MMKNMLLCALLAGATAIHAGAAEKTAAESDSAYHYEVELNGSAATGDFTPFYLTANRMGLSSIKRNNGYIRAGFFKENSYDSRFSWNFGIDLAGAAHYTSAFIVQQLYAGVRYRSLDLTVGSKEMHSGIVDRQLSSGDMLFSGSARPIPQARIGIERWTYIPYTKHKLAVKGYFSVGMFTDQDWQYTFTKGHNTARTKDVLFHAKGLFLRWGDTEKFPLTIEGGLEMATQWGGTIIQADGSVIHAPHGFKNFIKAIIPMHSSSNDDTFSPDKINVEGNHLGQWIAAIGWAPKHADWSARLYYEHFFDDHSMMTWDYVWRDMLLGVELKLPKNPVVEKFVYEYLTTKDQSGPVLNESEPNLPEQVSGCDNYYNNWMYNAWQHWGIAIGNPLLLSPIYNSNGAITFYHNRVKAHHFGFSGRPTPEIDYRVLVSYTRSWGSYALPTPQVKTMVNTMVEVGYSPRRLEGWGARLTFGADGGSMMGHNYGAMLSITKKGWL